MDINIKFKIVQKLLLISFIATIPFMFVENVYADECSEVLKLVNEERAAHSLQPLKMDKDLKKAAKIRSKEVTTVFSHTRPDGSRCFTVCSKANAENLAAGQKTPEKVVTAWMNSPGHRKNILNPNYSIIGISYKKTDNGYKTYWVQLFGGKKTKKIYLEKVSGIKAESKKNQITLKWNKQTPSKATGYQVFIYNSKTKNYQLLKKITKYSTNTLIIKGLQSSTVYKYKIRSYKVINGKAYYTTPLTVAVGTKD